MRINMSNGVLGNQVNKVAKVVVKCLSCNRPLFDIIVTNEDSSSCKIVGKCGFCGGSSIKHVVNGRFYVGSCDSNIDLDVLDELDNDTQVVLAKRSAQ
jgi:hypothetical protein